MVMPSRSSSSGMQSIRRELQRRRAKALAPKSSPAKKPSASPPRQEHLPFAASKSPRSSAGTHAPPCRWPRPSPNSTAISSSTPPPSCSAPSSAGSACLSTHGSDERLRPGTAVGVRTRTTKLKTGKTLVLWLRATVVSPTHGGYEVAYDGNWPPGDPCCGTVDVPRRHVRVIKSSPSTPPPSLPRSRTPSLCASATAAAVPASQKKEMPPTPRPTTAGKSLRLVRSLFPELERHARPVFQG